MNKSQQKKSLSVACTYVDPNSTDNQTKKMKISKKRMHQNINNSHFHLSLIHVTINLKWRFLSKSRKQGTLCFLN